MARVLLVEDDACLRRLLRRLLEGWGHTVEEFDYAAAAVAAASDVCSLLVVDYPVGGAALEPHEAAGRLGLAAGAGPARVIYMTSHPAPPVPGAGYVVKPFGASQLHTALERAVRRLPCD